MIQFWITILLLTLGAVTYADVSHLQHQYEPQYNIQAIATNTHKPIYTIPPTRYDQVVAASSHSERYSYDPPASHFNPFVDASERKSSYSSPQEDYYGNDKQDNFGAASELRSTYATSGYSGIPTYAGYQHTGLATNTKPAFSAPQRVNTLKPTYAGYQPIPAASESRRNTYHGYEPVPAASEIGYEYNVAEPSYESNVYSPAPSYNSRRTSYETPRNPSYSNQAYPTIQKSTYTQSPTHLTSEQRTSGQYQQKSSTKSGQYNTQTHSSGKYQSQPTKSSQHQPQASVQRDYYSQTPLNNQAAASSIDSTVLKSDKSSTKSGQYNHQTHSSGKYQSQQTKSSQHQPQESVQRNYYSQTPFNYQTAASSIDSTVLKSDGYHYDKPEISFDPAPIRTPDSPSRLYEDAIPPVERPTHPPPHNYYNPVPTPAPIRFNPAPIVKRPTFNPPPTRTTFVTPPTVQFHPEPVKYVTPAPYRSTSLQRVEEIEEIINTTTPAPPIIRITPRTTPRPRPTRHQLVNTTPYHVTFPPPKVSDVVLLAFSPSTISPHSVALDNYTPPPDVSATVSSVRLSDRFIDEKQPEVAPFFPLKPVNPIGRLEASASEDQFQYLPPESPTFGGLREDGYHYQPPSIPFF